MTVDKFSPRQARLATFTCALVFLVIGIGGTLLGPTLPNWAARFNLPLQNAGLFPSVQSLGIVFGVLLCGWLLDRLNARTILIGGALFLSAGLWLYNFAQSLPVALMGGITFGLGFGALAVSPNVVVAVLNPVNTSASLNLLNVFFGVGAIFGPQVANIAFAHNDYTLAYRLVGGLALLLCVPLLTVSVHTHSAPIESSGKPVRPRGMPWLALLPFAALLFVYVGSESGFGSWISTQMEQVALSSAATGTIATSLFWAGLTVGRTLASVALRRLTNYQALAGATILMGAGAALILFDGRSELISLSAAFLVGFGCGPIFPTAFTIASGLYPEARGAVSGLLIAIGSAGSVILSWVQGRIGNGQNGGIALTLLAAMVMLLLTLAARHRTTVVETAAVPV